MTDRRNPRKPQVDAAFPAHYTRRHLLRAAGISAGTLLVGRVAGASNPVAAATAPLGTRGSSSAGSSTFSAALVQPFPDLDTTVVPWEAAMATALYWAESLYRVDQFPPRAEYTPELAVAMPEVASPTTSRVTLRDGVTFHDGSPLTADDVVFTIERIKDPDTQSMLAVFFEIVDAARAIDEQVVELDLVTPTTALVQRLAMFPVLSRNVDPETNKLAPVGSGPYQVTSATSSRSVVLERFGEYSGDRQLAFERIEIEIVSDANARLSGLRTGQFSMIEDVPASSYEQLDADDGIEIAAVDSYASTSMLFNCSKSPFDDVRIRQAVLYGIDRDTITETSFFGHATPSWAGWTPSWHPGFNEPDTTYRFDPDRARELIAEAGHGDETITIELLVSNDLEFLVSQAPVIQQNLNDVGFDVAIVPGESAGNWGRAAEGDFDAFLSQVDASIISPDVELMLRFHFHGDIPRQFAHWDSPRLDELEQLLDDAAAAAEAAVRDELLAQAQNLIQDETPIASIHHKKQLTAWSTSLTGFEALPRTGFIIDGVTG